MKRSTADDRRGRSMLIVLLVVFLLLAVTVFWIWRKQPAPIDVDAGRTVADNFLELIRAGQAAKAWESTTAEFKSAEGRESFVRYVKEHPVLGKPLTFASVQTVTLQDTPRAEFVYRTSDATGTVRLLTGDERGSLRIDRITID